MEKAVIVVKDSSKTRIDVDFNPSEYSISFSPKYNEKTGAAQGKILPEFTTESKESLTVTLTLDGFTQGNTLDETKAKDISGSVKQLRALSKIEETLHRPPECSFQWGAMCFDGFVTDMSVQYTMFSSDGKPLRATVKLTMLGKDTKATALQSPDRTKRRVLRQDVPLYMLAYEAYENPAEWRHIAMANGIRNPRKLEMGAVLRIPPLE